LFWAAYVCGGLSDLIDGPIARGLNQLSEAGAKLDSLADLVFMIAIVSSVLRSTVLPGWILLCAIAIALIRIAAYTVGYCKFHTFSALHTVMNKATGALLFLFPVLLRIFDWNVAGLIVCVIAGLSSFEELAITISARELDRNCKSLFTK
ncbi:MAG: CDP-alcohol phosphatidyltransferase family protein, partial [Lawsonibacter sp.]